MCSNWTDKINSWKKGLEIPGSWSLDVFWILKKIVCYFLRFFVIPFFPRVWDSLRVSVFPWDLWVLLFLYHNHHYQFPPVSRRHAGQRIKTHQEWRNWREHSTAVRLNQSPAAKVWFNGIRRHLGWLWLLGLHYCCQSDNTKQWGWGQYHSFIVAPA